LAGRQDLQLPTDDGVLGHDGEEWILEGVSQGKYHVANKNIELSAEDSKTLEQLIQRVSFTPSREDHHAVDIRLNIFGELRQRWLVHLCQNLAEPLGLECRYSFSSGLRFNWGMRTIGERPGQSAENRR
jgi:hypothetical protein